jgi:hypothetical protein
MSVKRTFRQRAIIDKLTTVLNPRPTALGSPPSYAISIGNHSEPTLLDNGTIEKIADKLLRGSHQPKR